MRPETTGGGHFGGSAECTCQAYCGSVACICSWLAGTVGWFVTVGHCIEQLGDRPGMVMPLGPLALFIAVTALSSVVLRPRSE